MPYLTALAPVFALVLVGIWLGRRGVVHQAAETALIRLHVDFLSPALIFSSVVTRYTPGMLRSAWLVLTAAILVVLATYALTYPVHSYLRGGAQGYPVASAVIASAHGNNIALGVPVGTLLFGPAALLYVVVYELANAMIFFSLGLWMLGQKGGLQTPRWQLMANPNLVAGLLGLMVALSGIAVPGPLLSLSQLLGQGAVPFGLLLTGVIIHSHCRPRRTDGIPLAAAVSAKLLLSPMLAMALVGFLPGPALMKGVIVMQAAMPTMIASVVTVRRYGDPATLAPMALVLSTFFSLFTIPLFVAPFQ